MRVCFPSTDEEPALQAAALGDGCPTECGAGHSDGGGHPSGDRQLRQKEVSLVPQSLVPGNLAGAWGRHWLVGPLELGEVSAQCHTEETLSSMWQACEALVRGQQVTSPVGHSCCFHLFVISD